MSGIWIRFESLNLVGLSRGTASSCGRGEKSPAVISKGVLKAQLSDIEISYPDLPQRTQADASSSSLLFWVQLKSN